MTDSPNPIGAQIAANQTHAFQVDRRCCEYGEEMSRPIHRKPARQDETAVDRRRYAAIASDVLRHANRIETTMFTGSIGLENHHTLTDKETLALRVCVDVATKHDAELASLRAKLAEAEAVNRGDPRTRMERAADADNSRARTMEIERDKALAEVERLSKGFHESCIVRQEAAEAKVHALTLEIAALKARTVKLPKFDLGFTTADYRRGWQDCAEHHRAVLLCHNVKVEGA